MNLTFVYICTPKLNLMSGTDFLFLLSWQCLSILDEHLVRVLDTILHVPYVDVNYGSVKIYLWG